MKHYELALFDRKYEASKELHINKTKENYRHNGN